MRLLPYLFCISLLWLQACKSDLPDCSGCADEYYGPLSIRKKPEDYLHKKFDTLLFEHSAGLKDTFISSVIENTVLDINGKQKGECCAARRAYYSVKEYSQKYFARHVNLTLGYRLTKNSTGEWTEGTNPEEYNDALLLSINNYTWAIPLDGDANKTFYSNRIDSIPELTLGNRIYTNVLHAYYEGTSSIITPQGIYYTRSDGIIGFYFTNGEQWYRR